MTFTYQLPTLNANPIYGIRFMLGDTNDSGHLLEDEEIQWAYDRWFPKYGRSPILTPWPR